MDPENVANLAIGEGKRRISWLGRSVSIFSLKHDRRKNKVKELESAGTNRWPGNTTTNFIKPPTGSTQTRTETTENTPTLKGLEPETFFSTYVQPSCAELLGVTIYVCVGTLVRQTQTSCLANGIIQGLLITLLAYSFGKISGGHFNPVVSLSVMATGALSVPLAVSFVICQIFGSVLGSVVSLAVMSFKVTNAITGESFTAYNAFGGGTPELGDGVCWWHGVVCEAQLTFVWVMTVLMTSVNRRTATEFSGLAVGAAVTVGVVAGSKVSGGSLNPARSFGPTIVMSLFDRGVWRLHFIYWAGPAIGGLVATFAYRLLLADMERRLTCLPVPAPPKTPPPAKSPADG